MTSAPIRGAATLSLVLALAAGPAPAAAQSLLGAGGLGVPVTPGDARSQALGNLGIGMRGAYLLPSDPAAAADLIFPTLTFTMRHSWVDLEGEGAEASASGARFPVLGLAYPVRDWGMATLTFNSVLDQRWDVQVERHIDIGGGELARVTDTFVSDGGVSAVRVGFASRVAPSLAVGVTAGRYIGDVSRDFVRSFDSLAVEKGVEPFRLGGRWSFDAPTVTGGVQVDVGDYLRLAGSVTWSGALEANPDEQTEGARAEFDLPLEYRLGASGALTPGLNVAFSLAYADWSDTDPAVLTGAGGSETLDLGAGIEWTEGSLLGRRAPLRLGWRKSEYPFRFDGSDPSESAFSAGVGLEFVRSGGVSLAGADFSLERGERTAGSLSESFWRATLSLRVAGL